MNYQLKTTDGKVYDLLFNVFFLRKYSKLKGLELNPAMEGLGKLVDGVLKGGNYIAYIDGLIPVCMAAIDAHNVSKGVFEPIPENEVEAVLSNLGSIEQSFTIYGEIMAACLDSILPNGLGDGEKTVKKKDAAKK